MGEWYANPLVWIGFPSLLAVTVGLIFGLGQWKGKVDADRDTFKRTLDAFMVEIRADIKRIFERLPAPQPVASASPLRLTDLGRSISDELNVPMWATATAPNLPPRARGLTACKVQEMCFEYVRNEWKPHADMDARIDDCAYSRGMARKNVLDVFAIELRNRLLAHLGIPES